MSNKIREGDIYKVVTVGGEVFEIYYGYYDERERQNVFGEPIPIYPDLKESPRYTTDGELLVTAMQDVCERYGGMDREIGCQSCSHYRNGDELIGICTCHANKKK